MSLINQMLRDLDQREVTEESPRVIDTPQPVPKRTAQKGRRYWPVWIVLVVVVLAVGLYLQPQPPVALMSLFDAFKDSRETPLNSETKPPAVSIQLADQVSNTNAVDTREPVPAPLPSSSDQTLPVGNAETATSPSPVSGRVPVSDAKIVIEKPAEQTPLIDSREEPVEAMVDFPPAEQLADKPMGEHSSLDYKSQKITEVKKAMAATPPVKPVIKPVEKATQKQTPKVPEPKIVSTPEAPEPKIVSTPEAPKIQVKKVPTEQVQASSDELFQTAILQLNEGRLIDAEQSLRHVLELDDENHEARRFLALLLLNAGERSAFFSLLNEGLKIVPGHAPFVLLLGRAFIESGEQIKAIGLLEQQLPEAGSDVDLLAMLGSLYQQAGRYDPAISVYRRLVKLQPDNARAIAGLAISLDATGEYDQALVLYRQALSFNVLPVEVSKYARQRVLSLSAER